MNPCAHCTVLQSQRDEIEALKAWIAEYSDNTSFTCSGRLEDGTLCLRKFNLATGEVSYGWDDSCTPSKLPDLRV
jgi:hypothetical protein